jgi:hypothetical protein
VVEESNIYSIQAPLLHRYSWPKDYVYARVFSSFRFRNSKLNEIESAENGNSDVEDDVENTFMEMQVAGRQASLEMQRAITCGICASISRPGPLLLGKRYYQAVCRPKAIMGRDGVK